VHEKLHKFLGRLEHSPSIKEDDESLVFMCNVLHIFEDKILKSVADAQLLIAERKKEKNIVDPSVESGIRRRSYNRLRLNSENNSSMICSKEPCTPDRRG
jgi:hypothetical protein